jgi:quercetin dioxygenase-like cupin family protein
MLEKFLAKLVPGNGGKCVNVLGNQLRIILSGKDTSGTIELVELIASPGVGVPPHVHSREDEVFIVTRGEADFTVDKTVHRVSRGDVLYGSRNVAHGFVAVGREPCHIYFTVSPATLEPMFDELAKVKNDDGAEVERVCQRYGIQFVTAAP